MNSDLDGPTFNAYIDHWMKCEGYNPLDVLKHTSAVAVLGELSVGGSLMRGAQESSTIRKFKFPVISLDYTAAVYYV